MIRFMELFCLTLLIFLSTSYLLEDKFITFNTSSSKYVISTSIATNFDKEFAVFCPVLINTKDSTAQFIPTEQKKKLAIEPKFVEDNQLLYNDYHDGEYWYGFKKPSDQNLRDTTATFAFSRIIVDEVSQSFFIPLFNLPLTFLNVENLYKCNDVLISYKKTNKLIDVTVFSAKEGWSLYPQAFWGFRNKDEELFFSRQTYPLGTTIEVNISADRYCILNDEIQPNQQLNLKEEQFIYTLEELLQSFSSELEVRGRNIVSNPQNATSTQQNPSQL